MDLKYKSILLFGAPGSGKGLQGAILNNIPKLFHLAAGDVFRGLDKNSDLGKTFMEYSSQGKLVPDDLTISIWSSYVNKSIESGKYNQDQDLLILDGIPRTLAQVEKMDSYIDVQKVIHLNCSDMDILVKRIINRAEEQGRADDFKEEIIRNRMEVYKAETMPIIENAYQGKISNIDALLTPMEVLHSILSILIPLV